MIQPTQWQEREHSGSVVECLTWDWRATGSSLTGGTALCPWARHINPCLVKVQHRKTHFGITEKVLTAMKRIKSNEENNKTVARRHKKIPLPGVVLMVWKDIKHYCQLLIIYHIWIPGLEVIKLEYSHRHVSTSSQSVCFILSLRLYSSFITTMPAEGTMYLSMRGWSNQETWPINIKVVASAQYTQKVLITVRYKLGFGPWTSS